jgi:hypothetical protein
MRGEGFVQVVVSAVDITNLFDRRNFCTHTLPQVLHVVGVSTCHFSMRVGAVSPTSSTSYLFYQ